MTTGERIKSERLKKNMSQKRLGDLAGLADSAIRKYESGKVVPKIPTLEKIAKALDVPLADVLGVEVQEADSECNLLVIKLKGMDSVPEVYYKGQRLKGGLVDIQYHYHTSGDEEVNAGCGVNDILLKGYDLIEGYEGRKYLTIDAIKHERQKIDDKPSETIPPG